MLWGAFLKKNISLIKHLRFFFAIVSWLKRPEYEGERRAGFHKQNSFSNVNFILSHKLNNQLDQFIMFTTLYCSLLYADVLIQNRIAHRALVP